MRSSLLSTSAIIAALWSFATLTSSCATNASSDNGSDATDYDGTADSMDSLPDCIPELEGSSFWVRDKKGAFDCSASGQWKNRKAAKKPDDADGEEPGAWTPRMIEK